MFDVLLAAVVAAGAPAEVQVNVGRIDRKALPALQSKHRPLPTTTMVEKVEEILASGACKFSGQSADRFDITVPYAVRVEPDGTSRRVVVQETGCAPLETYVGEVVLQLAREGDFASSASAQPRWYASEVNFNLR